MNSQPPDRGPQPPTAEPADRLRVASFRDALGLAMELADEFAFANVAVLLQRGGYIDDVTIAEGIGRTIEPVVSWVTEARSPALHRSDGAGPAVTSVLLVTVRPYEADVVRERDLELYRRSRWSLAAAGVDLIDWIETDGDLYRSYAYLTCPAEAWTGDPPSERRADAEL